MYSLSDLETFIAVVENKGVLAAAREQRLSPATVSHRLSKLERELATVLVFRDSRRVRLSPAGEIFYTRIGAIIEALRDAEHSIGARSSSVSGLLRVTMPPWVFSKYVMPRLNEFEHAFPDLKLDFLITDQFVNVVDDAQDVAIRVGQLNDSGLLSRKIVNNSRILCAAPSYIKKDSMPTTITELEKHFWVCLPWQRQLKLYDAQQKVHTFNAQTRFTISNSDNMTQAAIAGHGIAIKSRLAINDELRNGALVEVMPNALAQSDAPVWFLRPQNSLTTRKTEVFFDFMKSLFACTD
ncbi:MULTISPECIES: LysR family transcriptional regulator [unclassified Pseudoalteromonas]|uniref:LysR family transcriptional regulator n=1 Tax=unclassified Pseudoalteromonas TaxID=194690 RepID=UPI00110906CF|nr:MULTISPECIES: LysR family transcriptional regulator [unclassified Pseudoalteromonas]TMN79990.1 transcriptional regulator [Pseudoalteromonas sp. S410]TMN88104.1 transcriptional regulator [Pseudoalteromonas sp. S408]TMN95108.1 transcriptional regulator [Pseudoalteromonas sp. S407]TMN97757.1 transcriptional regulator [Pseudoalteromonas sp. S409]TMO11677.1 transcriptional regulator [Pseudoalteromonas sp. S186]